MFICLPLWRINVHITSDTVHNSAFMSQSLFVAVALKLNRERSLQLHAVMCRASQRPERFSVTLQR